MSHLPGLGEFSDRELLKELNLRRRERGERVKNFVRRNPNTTLQSAIRALTTSGYLTGAGYITMQELQETEFDIEKVIKSLYS